MTLMHALWILTAVHTKSDSRIGFCIQDGVRSSDAYFLTGFSETDYINAWEKVREECGLPVTVLPEPAQKPSK